VARVNAPYEAARATTFLAAALEREGDASAARFERVTARREFERLGADHDAAAIDE
jgi:hypothetical protein